MFAGGMKKCCSSKLVKVENCTWNHSFSDSKQQQHTCFALNCYVALRSIEYGASHGFSTPLNQMWHDSCMGHNVCPSVEPLQWRKFCSTVEPNIECDCKSSKKSKCLCDYVPLAIDTLLPTGKADDCNRWPSSWTMSKKDICHIH